MPADEADPYEFDAPKWADLTKTAVHVMSPKSSEWFRASALLPGYERAAPASTARLSTSPAGSALTLPPRVAAVHLRREECPHICADAKEE